MAVTFDFYPGGKRKALTLSYDDGQVFDKKLIEIMNKYKIKGSFHLNSTIVGKEGHIKREELKELYKGHEVSLHGAEHLFLARIPEQMIIEEIENDRKFFESTLGYVVNGLSYAMGSYSDDAIKILQSLGIAYSRTTLSTEAFEIPEDFLKWHPTAHHNNPRLMELAKSFAEYPVWLRKMPVFYLWGHSYEFNRDDNWDVIEEFCKYVSQDDDIWFATNMEIYSYINALKGLRFSADLSIVNNPSAQSVWIAANNEPVEIKSGETVMLNK